MQFVAMPGCIHSVCKECFKGHFTLVITTQEVKHFTCPICGEPDMANQTITEGLYLQLFLVLVREYDPCVTALSSNHHRLESISVPTASSSVTTRLGSSASQWTQTLSGVPT